MAKSDLSLTNVMDCNNHVVDDIKSVLVAGSEIETANNNNNWLEVEQTEPLNLCLNTFTMVEYYPEFIDCNNLGPLESDPNDTDDSDVIFVKEYQVRRGASTQAEPNRRHNAPKTGTPRRNPVRRTRSLQRQRFKEYTDGSSLDIADFIDADEVNDEEIDDYKDIKSGNNGREDDWNIQMCKMKPKRRILTSGRNNKNKSTRIGRRKKVNNDVETKELFSSLQPLLEENLLLLKDYVPTISSKETKQKAIYLFKQQAVLVSIAKNIPLENCSNLFSNI